MNELVSCREGTPVSKVLGRIFSDRRVYIQPDGPRANELLLRLFLVRRHKINELTLAVLRLHFKVKVVGSVFCQEYVDDANFIRTIIKSHSGNNFVRIIRKVVDWRYLF